jgi:cytochrome P450
MTDITFSTQFNTIGSEEYRPVIRAFGQNNMRLGVVVQALEFSPENFKQKIFWHALEAQKVFLGFTRKLLADRLEDLKVARRHKNIFSFFEQATDPDTGEDLDVLELSAETAFLIIAGNGSIASAPKILILESVWETSSDGSVGSDTTSSAMAATLHYLN